MNVSHRWHVMHVTIVAVGIKCIQSDFPVRGYWEAFTRFLWTSPRAPFLFANFALYPFTVISHNHESNYMLSLVRPPGESSAWGWFWWSSETYLILAKATPFRCALKPIPFGLLKDITLAILLTFFFFFKFQLPSWYRLSFSYKTLETRNSPNVVLFFFFKC